jgi:hypothetical protein
MESQLTLGVPVISGVVVCRQTCSVQGNHMVPLDVRSSDGVGVSVIPEGTCEVYARLSHL